MTRKRKDRPRIPSPFYPSQHGGHPYLTLDDWASGRRYR